MPFNLIVIFTPKKVDVDEDGDVIEPKPTSVALQPTIASAPTNDPQDATRNETNHEDDSEPPRISTKQNLSVISDSTKTIRRNSKALSYDSEYSTMRIQETADSQGEGPAEGSAKNIIEKKDDADGAIAEVNVENFLKEALETLRKQEYISTSPTFVDDQSGRNLQVSFVCERGDVDVVIAHLAHIGVGTLVGNVNVMSLESSKFYRKTPEELREEQRLAKEQDALAESEHEGEGGVLEGEKKKEVVCVSGEGEAIGEEKVNEEDKEKAAKKIFLEAASQIRVEQIVEQIEGSASFTFDYLALLLIASTIAGIGLATNNTVAIVASMLVSPIMGPVMALTFGTVVNNWSLTLLGLRSELVSLLMCICVGFVIGIIAILIGTDGLWPTEEMKGRGLVDGLAIGFAIAIPSGVGVALSILGNNTSSLVGVAISASLLPPAVNCGLAFAYAAMGFQVDSGARQDDDDVDYTTPTSFVNMGGISLALTIVNIGAIYVSGLMMFRIKEVVPIKNKTAFWQRDIQVSRRINTALHKQRDYRIGLRNGQGLYHLQSDLQATPLNKDMRHELLKLRRAQSVHEALSTSTIHSPAAQPEARPRLMDLFGSLAKASEGEGPHSESDDDEDGMSMQPSPSKKQQQRSSPLKKSASSHNIVTPARPHRKSAEEYESVSSVRSYPHRDHYLDSAGDLSVGNLKEIKKRFRAQGHAINMACEKTKATRNESY